MDNGLSLQALIVAELQRLNRAEVFYDYEFSSDIVFDKPPTVLVKFDNGKKFKITIEQEVKK